MNTYRFYFISLVVLLFATVSCTKSVFGIGLVQSYEAESVTEISATVTGKVRPEPGMQDVMVGFLWSTDSYPDITNSQKVRVTEWTEGKPYSLRLAGLSPMTTYYYKAYVQYDGEVCKFGEVKSFTTRGVTTINGVECAVLTSRIPGKTDQSIILPFSGYFREDIRCGYEECRSWTSTAIWEGNTPSMVYAGVISSYFGGNTYTTELSFGLPIRPVKDKPAL